MSDPKNPLPLADPVASRIAEKARSTAEAAEARARQAEMDAAPAAVNQPTVSSLKTRHAQVYEGEQVKMRVTSWGHGQISTGGEHGFERYARDAIIECAEVNARDLYRKRFAEPLERGLEERWVEMEKREQAASYRAKMRQEHVLENGVAAGEHWSTATNG